MHQPGEAGLEDDRRANLVPCLVNGLLDVEESNDVGHSKPKARVRQSLARTHSVREGGHLLEPYLRGNFTA